MAYPPASPLPAPEPPAVPDDLAQALRRQLEAGDGGPVRRIDTHISTVLLTPAYAYKLKKPVTLDFVDFGTPERRRHFCEEELRINRRTAPDIYLDVVRITGTPQAPALDGPGAVLDHAVRMRRFPDDAVLDACLARGALLPVHMDRLARRLGAFHAAAPVADAASGYGTPDRVAGTVARVLDDIRALDPTCPGADLERWLHDSASALPATWARRLAQGHVREVHGDLHLGNVVLIDDEPTPFDAIEFDPALRWIDTMSDVAFFVMDLLAHARRDLGWRFLNAYLDETGDHDGLPVLRHALVYRALVRALVSLLRQGAGAAANAAGPDYLALARTLARPGDPRLLITHGLPGSGKTWRSQGLLEQAGAIRLRSDVERKRLFGLHAAERSGGRVPGGIYGTDATRRTYERLHELAAGTLRAGYPTIIDAAFLRRDERDRFAALAADLRVPFTILDCRADPAVLRERVAARTARGGDASEADVAILERLSAACEALDAGERATAIVSDAARPASDGQVADEWLARPAHMHGP